MTVLAGTASKCRLLMTCAGQRSWNRPRRQEANEEWLRSVTCLARVVKLGVFLIKMTLNGWKSAGRSGQRQKSNLELLGGSFTQGLSLEWRAVGLEELSALPLEAVKHSNPKQYLYIPLPRQPEYQCLPIWNISLSDYLSPRFRAIFASVPCSFVLMPVQRNPYGGAFHFVTSEFLGACRIHAYQCRLLLANTS